LLISREMKRMKPAQLFAHWKQIRNDLIFTINQFTDDELRYVPFENSWSVGQIAVHIANAENGWFQHVLLQNMDSWPEDKIEDYQTRGAIIARLTEVHRSTEAYLDQLEEEDLDAIIEAPWGDKFPVRWIFWHLFEHEIHHRGELSMILGLLGRQGLDV